MTMTFGKPGLMDFFRGRDRTHRVRGALARILSQHDLEHMPFEAGIEDSRRCDAPRRVAIGVMLIPFNAAHSAAEVDFSQAVPAVTFDLRRQGIGLMLTQPYPSQRFAVAIPDPEAVWKFFECECRHQSRRPGGWWRMGLHLHEILHPDMAQLRAFRDRCLQTFPDSPPLENVEPNSNSW